MKTKLINFFKFIWLKKYLISRKYRSYFFFWKKIIKFTLFEFQKLNLVKQTEYHSWLNFDEKKWKTLDAFISEFNSNLMFMDNCSEQQKEMINHFYFFTFYHLAYKMSLAQLKIPYLEIQPYLKQNKIEVNACKREHYFRFLEHFKLIPGYNPILIRLLKVIK